MQKEDFAHMDINANLPMDWRNSDAISMKTPIKLNTAILLLRKNSALMVHAAIFPIS